MPRLLVCSRARTDAIAGNRDVTGGEHRVKRFLIRMYLVSLSLSLYTVLQLFPPLSFPPFSVPRTYSLRSIVSKCDLSHLR